MRELKNLLISTLLAALWPSYLVLLAYTARQAPWPRNLGLVTSSTLAVVGLAAFLINFFRRMLQPGGWVETVLRVPPNAARQLSRAAFSVIAAGVLLLWPEWLLLEGMILHAGRPISAPGLCRFLELGFGVMVWGVVYLLVRGRSPLVEWLVQFPERLGWLNRRRRALAWSLLAVIGAVIVLDARGYSYSARRIGVGAAQFLGVVVFCWGLYRLLLKAISNQAWRWMCSGPSGAPLPDDATDDSGQPTDLVGRLRRLTGYVIPLLGLFLTAWAWNLDLALIRSLGEQSLIVIDKETAVTLGELTAALVILAITAVAWRHLSTLFAIALFPKMPDDPGVRFAVLTLCRYTVLGIGLLASLSSVHLGLAKIGMVLAALGVGLGFGLQEIVSNFVCGIILLLERPIRVGDIVTVAGMNGKVDRINIRATTIVNIDNQSMIIPNRAFITSDLINWTLKDKIVRTSVRVKAAHGNDPDAVTALLLTIAREDADVLRNPVPASFLEDFSDSAMIFALHVHVPDPSLSGRVRHRLLAQIQKRFKEAGIEIPLPAQELLFKPAADASAPPGHPLSTGFPRWDHAIAAPPEPHRPTSSRPVATVKESHRGVDE